LARSYWLPIYSYLRRNGHPPAGAEDLTQAFFARLIEKNDLRSVDPVRGRFRSFVLAALNHFVSNERDKERAQKRGGGIKTISLSVGEAELRYSVHPADTMAPERMFNRRWAITVLNNTIDRLAVEYQRRDQHRLFEVLQSILTGELTDGYAEIAQKLEMSEGALQVSVHRMKKRYRELLRQEVARTVADPSLINDELRELLNSV